MLIPPPFIKGKSKYKYKGAADLSDLDHAVQKYVLTFIYFS